MVDAVNSKCTSLRSTLYQLLQSVDQVEQFTREVSRDLRQEIQAMYSTLQTSQPLTSRSSVTASSSQVTYEYF